MCHSYGTSSIHNKLCLMTLLNSAMHTGCSVYFSTLCYNSSLKWHRYAIHCLHFLDKLNLTRFILYKDAVLCILECAVFLVPSSFRPVYILGWGGGYVMETNSTSVSQNSVCSLHPVPFMGKKERKKKKSLYLYCSVKSGALLQMLTGSPLVKFPAFYGNRELSTVFTRACYLSLS